MLRRLTLTIAMALLILNPNSLNAAWWEGKDFPLPMGAQEANQETRRIGGAEFVFTYYSTTQENADSIKAFYRMKLSSLGWKEKELLNDLRQAPNFQVTSGLSDALGQNLMFEKDGEILIVNLMPEQAFNDNKTRFAIAKGKMDFKNAPTDEAKLMPTLLTKPKKEVAPLYPGATLVNLSEGDVSSQQLYYTKDGIESVSKFYKENMPGLGWDLREEKPIQEAAAEGSNFDLYKYCPNCPKDERLNINSIKSALTELHFYNYRGDECNIVISNQSTTQAAESPFGSMTIIMVNYAEKKD